MTSFMYASVYVHGYISQDHLHSKTALDLVLDTTAKNGHTTGLDAVWAGVPTVTLGQELGNISFYLCFII